MTTMQADSVDAVRSDGGLVNIRSVRADDLPALRELHRRASDQSMYLRYFGLNREAGDDYLNSLVTQGNPRHQALLACIGDDVVGVAALDRTKAESAEVAILVADAQQHTGIGTLLLEHLASQGRRAGVRRFVAEVMTTNSPMIHVFRDLGYAPDMRFEDGQIHVTFDLDVTAAVIVAMDARAASAAAARLGLRQ
jgi:GNAT superfamily N-acetyltransferase